MDYSVFNFSTDSLLAKNIGNVGGYHYSKSSKDDNIFYA